MFFFKLCVSSMRLVSLHAVAILLHPEKPSVCPAHVISFRPFFLSFWLSFFPSFFHCLEFMPADCLGVDLLDLLSIFTKCTFERSLKCLTLGQEVFRILKHDKILQKTFRDARTFSVSSPFVMTQNLNPTSWCWFHLF